MNISPSIGIIGAGSWGTALAEVLAENGYHPLFWTRSNEISHEINSNHTNSLFLPGTKLHKRRIKSRTHLYSDIANNPNNRN